MKASTLKNLPIGWKDEADAMNETHLRAVIVDCSNNLRTIEKEMGEDSNLQKLKEKAKDAGAGYNEAKLAQKAKIDYALHCLEQKGKI
jgi:hypothetical protein